jgi:hypothetical protein
MINRGKRTFKAGLTGVQTVWILFILLVVFLVVFAVSPWGAYERAKHSGTERSYERFLENHPDSMFVAPVKERLAELKLDLIQQDPSGAKLQGFLKEWSNTPAGTKGWVLLRSMAKEKWKGLAESGDVAALQRFESDYEGTTESELAKDRRVDLIPRFEWKALQTSISLEELTAFVRKYEKHEVAQQARERIRLLCRDHDWVKRQDRLEIYRIHLELVPNSPLRSEMEKRIIDLEVAEIVSGEHGKLPPASPLSITGGNTAEVKIENQTSYTLTVRYSGSQSYRFDLAPSTSREVSLATGSYKVAATVSSPSVIPYAGNDTLSGGSYGVKFFIQTGFR